MNFKQKYSDIYDDMYSTKDYRLEVDYICTLFEKGSGSPTLFEIGCGTGGHAKYLLEKGYDIHAIDLSFEMLDIAQKKFKKNDRITFEQSNIIDYSSNETFDLSLMLFHVFSYLNTDDEILKALKVINNSLKTNGTFIFDYWTKDGVEDLKPMVMNKRFELSDKLITRKSTPLSIKNNIVSIRFDITVLYGNKEVISFSELHRMRYFSNDEITSFLNRSGFVIVKNVGWLKETPATKEDWAAVCVAKKC
jgi:SAM-dependent methyltransferase